MSGTEFQHVPVLKREVLEYLTFPEDRPCRMIDGTVGGGGHSGALLERYPRLELLGIDRDESALEAAAERLRFAGDRVHLLRGDFSSMKELAASIGWQKADGILLDIGVSSPQLDRAERGFSWRMSGPLDMRMDQRSELTAARLLNRSGEEELTRIFRDYGEVRPARRLAQAVIAFREKRPFAATEDLVTVCDEVLGRARGRSLPPPTLVFQAVRIAVNGELDQLEDALNEVPGLLNPGGIIAVISFHSLEDRIVKNFFRERSRGCICPPGLPVCVCGHRAEMEVLTRKSVTASEDELAENRRAACARLRAARRLNVIENK